MRDKENEMNIEFENPFADYGIVVRGDRFIGRSESLKVIENRSIRPKQPGNLAIIGEPRIGKSSLVYKAVLDRKRELTKKNFLPVWINLANYDHPNMFFRSLVTETLEEMKWLSEPVEKSARLALEDQLSQTEGYRRIQKFFEKIKQAGFRVLFILDEFDHARHLFKGRVSDFQRLRELSYRPEWRVGFITTSRRSIKDIETQTGAISTFDGIFHKHYLAMFEDKEVEEYCDRLLSVGVSLSSEDKERINFYCGHHPYLLEMLGYEIAEIFRDEQKTDVEKAAYCASQAFLGQYDRMISLLKEDNSLNKMIQILFGPVFDVKQTDVDEFLRYGLIKSASEEESYVAYSSHFHLFLNMVGRDIDLWKTWQDTEKALRQLVATVMIERYGENWIDRRERKLPKLKTVFDSCRKAQQSEIRTFKSRASQNLLDFTYPGELFVIIFAEWENFKLIFGKDKGYWAQRSQLLSKVRNPLAHNRDQVIHDYERQIAEGYCNEILSLVKMGD